MPPKKGKTDKQAAEDASSDGTAMILDYLPYAVKALRELHQKKEIECRVAGKQTVYHVTQEESDENNADVVAAMDEEIQSLQEQLPRLKEDEKKLRAELNSLNAVPLLSELRAEIKDLEGEKESLAARLAKVHGDGEVNVSPRETEAARKYWKFWQGQARIRARICRDLWYKCSETLPEGTSREELWERLGLEGSPL
ncbi:Tat binding protein 1-interacting protein-domain-containing protein [Aspergillus granulosus]|uniref:Tat binding protein 1-interacting protein-domain-containing protein n=1 Tax=Aspergillus granulosus TaxID=176169 RepID=A0ABR4HMD1_9EURO